MGVIGSLTAFFAGIVGLVQGDLKKVIAYSTCSQLGLMVLACGCLCFSSALYHLVNHAFFKALLFLSGGSCHKCDIIVITRVRGTAEDEC